MRNVGYARISAADPVARLDERERALHAVRCLDVFREQARGDDERPILAECLASLGADETLIVTRPERLARTPYDFATRLGNHSFRATGITACLKNGGTLEKAAQMANHASTRTTQLYDRRREELSLDEVERIRV